MNITFLGTAAATSYPLAFCRCDYCSKARELGGKDFRKRSSIIINNDLLIDFGPDVMAASFIHNRSITDIRYLLQTHPHSDHFDASHLATRVPEYLGVNIPPLDIYASLGTFVKMSEMLKNDGYVNDIFDKNDQLRMNIRIHTMKHAQSEMVGKYEVTAFSTDHDVAAGSMIYAIREDNFTVLYATDTDKLLDETWESFKNKNMHFNLVIMDHTYGPDADSGGHLNANRFIEQIERMKKENLLLEKARIIATHLSHEGNSNHAELSQYAQDHGYEIGYDGLVIELK